ncbi:ATP-binding protein [Sorangium sp. So ce448]|uniref:ATP-binding protein n=1 Tax=Sorangium sp. So ce448 TaxID=3133314 RepID=UPI003F614DF1
MAGSDSSAGGRLFMGRRGIGKFAGLAVAKIMKLETWHNGRRTTVTFDRDTFDQAEDIDTIEVDVVTDECTDKLKRGTKITLLGTRGRFNGPTPLRLARQLIHQFGIREDFKLYVDNERVTENEIHGDRHQIDEEVAGVGKVTGTFVILPRSSPLPPEPGVTVMVRSRAVGRPGFFGADLQSDQMRDIRRIYGRINMDGLRSSITPDHSSFLEASPEYAAASEWLKSMILHFKSKIADSEVARLEAIILSSPAVVEQLRLMPEHLRPSAEASIKKAIPVVKAAPIDVVKLVASLMAKSYASPEIMAILSSLDSADPKDVTTLSKALETWGFGEIASIAQVIQNRLKVLDKFEELVRDDKTKEVSGLQSVLERNLWILDERYVLFSGNKTLSTIVDKMLKSMYVGRRAKERPDIIAKELMGDYVVLELKRPKHTVTVNDVAQAKRYRMELRRVVPNFRVMDVYVVGRQIDDGLREELKESDKNTYALTLSEIVTSARFRLKYISDALRPEVEEAQKHLATRDFSIDVGRPPAAQGNLFDMRQSPAQSGSKSGRTSGHRAT